MTDDEIDEPPPKPTVNEVTQRMADSPENRKKPTNPNYRIYPEPEQDES